MKTLNIKQLDEKDEEIIDALVSLGMSMNAAMTLAYMQNTNSATSIELERSTRLRQPEVSIVMKQLLLKISEKMDSVFDLVPNTQLQNKGAGCIYK